MACHLCRSRQTASQSFRLAACRCQWRRCSRPIAQSATQFYQDIPSRHITYLSAAKLQHECRLESSKLAHSRRNCEFGDSAVLIRSHTSRATQNVPAPSIWLRKVKPSLHLARGCSRVSSVGAQLVAWVDDAFGVSDSLAAVCWAFSSLLDWCQKHYPHGMLSVSLTWLQVFLLHASILPEAVSRCTARGAGDAAARPLRSETVGLCKTHL